MVISHNDPDPDEPPMAVPCVPINQRPMKADLIRAARQPWPRNIGAAVRRESPMRGGLKVTPVPIPSFDAGNANGRSGVREYLRGILSTKFNWQRSFRYDTETLLTLPRKRDLPQQYVDKWAGSPHLSKTAFLGLVMYLVGDEAESPCLGCHEPDPFEMCIVANEKFPPATTDYLKGSCAVCQFKYMKWHQKNLCSFIQDPDNMQLDDGYEHDPALSSVVPVDQRQYQREDNSSEVYADDSYALGLGVGSSTREEPDAVPERKQFMMTAKPGGFTSLKRRLRRAMNKPRQPPNAAQYDSNAVLLEPGQLMSAVENLEMEDWELAPGRIEDNDTSEGECLVLAGDIGTGLMGIRLFVSFYHSDLLIMVTNAYSRYCLLDCIPHGQGRHTGHSGRGLQRIGSQTRPAKPMGSRRGCGSSLLDGHGKVESQDGR